MDKQQKPISDGVERGSHRRYGQELCCSYDLKVEDFRNQLDFKHLTHLIIHHRMRYAVIIVELSCGQRRDVTFLVLQNSIDCVDVPVCCRLDDGKGQQRAGVILLFAHLP